ncbi:hypothetical protein [Baekduia sp. Peel2402]|uniref:hypothetical protein n=1 Tax=Baekduia sp. Peel2402 TaxID=3458296 RepID=UPI00403E3774
MPRRRLIPLTALGAAAALAAAIAGPGSPAGAAQTQSQKVFTQKLIDDAKTSSGVKKMLQAKTAIVDPRSGFVDVTGDGRQDALILVSTGGAGGAVALYVFSTHGQKTTDDTSLKVVFRLQSLYDATLRISGQTISILEPHWEKGDDLCCPDKLRERDYAFDAKALTFRRTADKDIDYTSTSTTGASTTTPGTTQ